MRPNRVPRSADTKRHNVPKKAKMITSTAIGHNRLSPGFSISQLQVPAMRHTPIVATMGRIWRGVCRSPGRVLCSSRIGESTPITVNTRTTEEYKAARVCA